VGDSVKNFINASPKPAMLWVRGDSDMIVSDTSFFDLGTLGQLGYVPGWPGVEIYPPQPMVSQTRHILEQYGNFEEVVIADTGHTPYVEKPAEFLAAFIKTISG
jgi:pimeloyl-ACP methyl ester carboxylesterase